MSLVKDLILSRKDGHIQNLNFFFDTAVKTVYPDYDISVLDFKQTQELFDSCKLVKLEIGKTKTTSQKIAFLELHIKNEYALNCDIIDSVDADSYLISIYEIAK